MPEVNNIPLLAGETALFAADFTASPIIRTRKNGLLITDQRVAVVHPQHMFVFIRVGQTVTSTLHDRVSEVAVGRLMSRSHIRLGLIFGALGLFSMTGSAGMMIGFGGGASAVSMLLTIVFFGLAGLQFWLARQLGLTVTNNSGHHMTVAVDSTENPHMLVAADMIQQLALGRQVAPYVVPPPQPSTYGNPAGPPPSQPPGWGPPAGTTRY